MGKRLYEVRSAVLNTVPSSVANTSDVFYIAGALSPSPLTARSGPTKWSMSEKMRLDIVYNAADWPKQTKEMPGFQAGMGMKRFR